VGQGADVTIRDNFNGRSPLEVAQYRQFRDIVAILSDAESRQPARPSSGPSSARGKRAAKAKAKAKRTGTETGTGESTGYIRPQEQIEKEGRRAVFSGVHGKHKDLFLGRYRLPEEAPALIERFRTLTANEGTVHIPFC
jgi:hypothetical protein